MRIGEALVLRHEDWAIPEQQVLIVPRRNDNGAWSKSGRPRTIPVSADLVRLYADYLHGEYGEVDSDYVFVNLWGEPRGHPLSYAAVYDLVRRLRRRTSVDFEPHPAFENPRCASTVARSRRLVRRRRANGALTPRRGPARKGTMTGHIESQASVSVDRLVTGTSTAVLVGSSGCVEVWVVNETHNRVLGSAHRRRDDAIAMSLGGVCSVDPASMAARTAPATSSTPQ